MKTTFCGSFDDDDHDNSLMMICNDGDDDDDQHDVFHCCSAEEAGRYLETYKVYENKAAEAIMERMDSSFNVQVSEHVNHTYLSF